MILLVLLAMAYGDVFAQISTDDIAIGARIELSKNGDTIQRRVAGLPISKILSQDENFTIRARFFAQPVWWQFVALPRSGDVRCWMHGPQPTINIQSKSDLNPTDILLEVPESDYRAAPALGDSLYFLHADPRTQLVDGVQLIQEDSREWGPVHAREFLRIVPAP